MSRLDELIQELCPDGVEYDLLKNISEMQRGTSLTKKNATPGNIPVVSGGREPAFYCDTNNRDGETITVAGSGAGAGYVQYWSEPIFVSDAFSIKSNEKTTTKYLYYCLEGKQDFIYSTQKGGGVPHVHISSIENMKIPVPPLEIQREIVRILDSFTLLTAELTAELTARKKQYEFYRDKLLTFDNVHGGATSNVVWRTLGEVCNLQSGKAISAYLISDTQTVENSIPCYGANGLRGYVSTSNESGDKPIVGRQGALCGNVCFATGSYYATEHAVVVTDKGFFNSRFLYHLLVNADLNQYKTAGAQPGLSVARLNEVKVPVPTRTVQDRIANVLDNFDVICSDLNIGLPAEIEARQKQYEYYRDALLTYAATGKIILDRQTDRQTDKHN